MAVFIAALFSDLKLGNVNFRSFNNKHEAYLSKRSFGVADSTGQYTDLQNASLFDNNHFLRPLLKGAFPNIKVPVLTDQEFRNINWSNKTRTIKRKHGLSIYHNYTAVSRSISEKLSLFSLSCQFLSYKKCQDTILSAIH
jgi:hypothetical protein